MVCMYNIWCIHIILKTNKCTGCFPSWIQAESVAPGHSPAGHWACSRRDPRAWRSTWGVRCSPIAGWFWEENHGLDWFKSAFITFYNWMMTGGTIISAKPRFSQLQNDGKVEICGLHISRCWLHDISPRTMNDENRDSSRSWRMANDLPESNRV